MLRNLWRPSAALCLLASSPGCSDPHGSPPDPTHRADTQSHVWLADFTERWRLDFHHHVGPQGTYFMPDSLGSGVAIFDFDHDDRMDLLLLQNAGTNSTARHQLFRQEPGGAFLDVSAGSGLDLPGRGMGVAVGDIDNDGRPDVLITEFEGARLFQNLGDGKFLDISHEAGISNPHWGTSAAFFDYDRDGWLDLIIVNYVDYSESNTCHDPQGRPTFCGPSGFPGTAPRLFKNLGPTDGRIRFQDVTVSAGLAALTGPGLGVVAVDVDGDAWQDLLVSNDGHMNWLLVNQRNGTFSEEAARRGIAFNDMGATQANMGIALGDVDGDQFFDILMTHLCTETHALWRQGPRGLFQDRTTPSRVAHTQWRGTGFGAVFADLNNDRAPDLAIVNGGIKRQPIAPAPAGKANQDPFWDGFEQRSQLLANDGHGVFADVSAENPAFSGLAAVARGLAVGDLDNDGGLDLVVTRIAAPARIFRNVAPRGHWLILRAVDPALGNRDAYGAEITVLAGGHLQTSWVNPSQSYLCSNDPRAHFGLGTAHHADEIRVLWPDGDEERFDGIQADQRVTLRKGSGRPVAAGKHP